MHKTHIFEQKIKNLPSSYPIFFRPLQETNNFFSTPYQDFNWMMRKNVLGLYKGLDHMQIKSTREGYFMTPRFQTNSLME